MAIGALRAAFDLPAGLIQAAIAVQVVGVAIEAMHPGLEMHVRVQAFKLTKVFSTCARSVAERAAVLHRRLPQEFVALDQPTTHGIRHGAVTISAGGVTGCAIGLPHM